MLNMAFFSHISEYQYNFFVYILIPVASLYSEKSQNTSINIKWFVFLWWTFFFWWLHMHSWFCGINPIPCFWNLSMSAVFSYCERCSFFFIVVPSYKTKNSKQSYHLCDCNSSYIITKTLFFFKTQMGFVHHR